MSDEDHQPDENNNNTVEIEEHFVEVQEGPLVDENYGDNVNNLLQSSKYG